MGNAPNKTYRTGDHEMHSAASRITLCSRPAATYSSATPEPRAELHLRRALPALARRHGMAPPACQSRSAISTIPGRGGACWLNQSMPVLDNKAIPAVEHLMSKDSGEVIRRARKNVERMDTVDLNAVLSARDVVRKHISNAHRDGIHRLLMSRRWFGNIQDARKQDRCPWAPRCPPRAPLVTQKRSRRDQRTDNEVQNPVRCGTIPYYSPKDSI